MQKQKVVAIVGSTASGKTALSIFLAQKISAEIISADSRQVYRGLDIGTGKVTHEETAGIMHHMLNVASPKKVYSASDFAAAATRILSGIQATGKVPIVVGGTGFYIDTLLGRMIFPDVPPNPQLRATLEKKSAEELFAKLQQKDPRRAASIERGNKRRLLRALEIASALGASPEGGPVLTAEGPFEVLWLGISLPEHILRQNIRKRLLSRVTDGMVDEAVRLHAEGLSYKRMDELGLEYRSLAALLQGRITPEVFLEQLEQAISRYAKRQLRWFKRNKDIHWVTGRAEALKLARKFLATPARQTSGRA